MSSPSKRTNDKSVVRPFSYILIAVGLACALVYLSYLYFGDPTDTNGWFPKCLFYKLTGFKCVGCGTQRAIHCLMHGEVNRALHYNAFVLCVLPWYLLGCLFTRIRNSDWYVPVGIIVGLVILVVRNLPGVDL